MRKRREKFCPFCPLISSLCCFGFFFSPSISIFSCFSSYLYCSSLPLLADLSLSYSHFCFSQGDFPSSTGIADVVHCFGKHVWKRDERDREQRVRKGGMSEDREKRMRRETEGTDEINRRIQMLLLTAHSLV